jgi:hypothetical protein
MEIRAHGKRRADASSSGYLSHLGGHPVTTRLNPDESNYRTSRLPVLNMSGKRCRLRRSTQHHPMR